MSQANVAPEHARRLSQQEFIAMVAMLVATIAFSIDAMLPSLPEIGAELSPGNLNRAQLILTSFVLGMGLGTFVTGPMSDAWGRKPVVLGGAAIYIVAALMAWRAASLEVMLAARLVQGIGAAGPRVAAMALIRDLYAGRDMARIVSFVMLVFALVPALAPSLGALIIATLGWRQIFLAFVVFSVISCLWLGLRQPETLAPAHRRPLRAGPLWEALREVLSHPTTRLSMLIQTLGFGMLFSLLSSTQQIFDVTFDQGAHFHLWFGGVAVVSASASLLNARLVMRVGMRGIIRAMFLVQIGIAGLMIGVTLIGQAAPLMYFGMFLIWKTSVFFQAGLTIGNLNALGMEPMGHVAGMAASIIAATSTVGAVVIAIPIGLAFDGTPMPVAVGALVMSALAYWLTLKIKRPGET